MNPPSGPSPRAPQRRAKGPAPCQPRATPWVTRPTRQSPERATQPVSHRTMSRPYRANRDGIPIPRALPWAGMARTFGAENTRGHPIHLIGFAVAAERAQHDAIVSLVERILAAKQANPAADTSALEREIDQQVYALYGLTPEEIAIVEGTAP